MEVWVNGGVVETAVSLIIISLPLAYNHIFSLLSCRYFLECLPLCQHFQQFQPKYRVLFSHDITAAVLVSQNNEMAAMLVSQTNPLEVLTLFLCKRFLLFQ